MNVEIGFLRCEILRNCEDITREEGVEGIFYCQAEVTEDFLISLIV